MVAVPYLLVAAYAIISNMNLQQYNSCSRNVLGTGLTEAEEVTLFHDELVTILPRLIQSYSKQRKQLEKVIARELTDISTASNDEVYRYYWTLWLMLTKGQELEEIDKHLARLHRFKNIHEGKPKPKGALPDGAIEAARAYPIEDIVKVEFRRSGNNLLGLCIFSDERTPSFYIYRDRNYACCFGACGFRGDSIELYMKLHGLDFKNAVLDLSGGRV